MKEFPNASVKSRAARWLAAAIALLVILLGVATVFLAVHWPFSKERTTRFLEPALHAKIGMSHFRPVYFPRPGCVIDGFTATRGGENGGTPIATAERVNIRANYPDFFLRKGYIARIVIDGLNVQVPARNSGNRGQNSQPSWQTGAGSDRRGARIGEVVANNSKLSIARSDGKTPLEFIIHSLTLDSVGPNEAMSYEVSMTNALPPGDLSARGRLGPVNEGDFSKTGLSGTADLEGADLAAFSGISGSLSSQLKFEGTFDNLTVSGIVDVPNFKLRRAGNSVRLYGPFHAQVDAMKGDVHLRRVDVSVDETLVQTRGQITGQRGTPGKTTALDFTVRNGRIQDMFEIFTKEKSPITGDTNFRARAVVHAFGKQFLKETQFQAQFQIDQAKYMNAQTQHNIDNLSNRAHRHKDNQKVPPVTSTLQGNVVLNRGIARFNNLSVRVPAATAKLDGTYSLLNNNIDFHGNLRTEAVIAKTTTGIKSLLLRPLDPLFKKKSAGAEVPVAITGTYQNPRYGIELAASKSDSKNRQQK
jgi:hypothetical protein